METSTGGVAGVGCLMCDGYGKLCQGNSDSERDRGEDKERLCDTARRDAWLLKLSMRTLK